jgi:20S proteasome alpha/beta subunit
MDADFFQGDYSKVSGLLATTIHVSSQRARMGITGQLLILRAVEYAMEAISHAGTVLAVLSKEGIAMAAEKVSAVGSLFSLLSTISGPCDH